MHAIMFKNNFFLKNFFLHQRQSGSLWHSATVKAERFSQTRASGCEVSVNARRERKSNTILRTARVDGKK
jgi:hypothetical protein